ncbi:MAG: class I SAM-dependent methyltransferase [Butyrivibrio sp.]|nr:class I SAM-dependent methyltransferase [Butyrivibrio sp.]
MNDVKEKMSERLVTVAELLRNEKAGRVADVGCDHGYISIYLVQQGIAESAIAMDIRKGPLSSAADNVVSFGMKDKIETRLSDGIEKLQPGEADAIVVAGMGGMLMMEILEKRDLQELGIKRAVLQPQSDICRFRQYLRDKGYRILDEKIVYEDGKYYFPMLVDTEGAKASEPDKLSEIPQSVADRFGVQGILRRDPLLKEYLLHGKDICVSILEKLDKEAHRDRYNEVSEELSDIRIALNYYERG